MTFSAQDSVIIPHEESRGGAAGALPFPLDMHKHTRSYMKNYKYPYIQWIAGARGILMIITAIITVIMVDVSRLEIAFYHHNLRKWNRTVWRPYVTVNANDPVLKLLH